MNRWNRATLPALILFVGVSSAYIIVNNGHEVVRQTPQLKLPRVEIIEAVPTTMRIDIKSQGIVKPRVEMKLVSEMSGRVIKLAPNFKIGGFFKKGKELVTIDSRNQNHAILDAKANIATAQKTLLLERSEAALARAGWELKGRGKASPLVLREPQILEASTRLAAAKEQLADAKLAKKQSKLRAYFDGLVLEKSVAVGQFVSSGETLATLFSTDTAEIRLPLSEDQLAYLDLPLLFTNDADSQQRPAVNFQAQIAGETHHWQGTVVATEGVIDEDTRQLYVVAQVRDPYNQENRPDTMPLMVGLFVQASIQGKVLHNVFALPRNALYGKHQLIIVENERIRLQQIEVLKLEPDRAIVRGLKAGQMVVTHRLENVVEGMRVQVVGESH